jgi:two-component system, OmpR family, phosphate regulon sensor histidine kinase PhoR
MPKECILIALTDGKIGELLARATLRPAGYEVAVVQDLATTDAFTKKNQPDLLIAGEDLANGTMVEWLSEFTGQHPHIPVILIAAKKSQLDPEKAMRLGLADLLIPPVSTDDILIGIQHTIERRRRWKEWLHLEAQRKTKPLQQRVDELETLNRIGHSLTATLNLDIVLTNVVAAAVEITNAEEGSLLLLDEETGELYMRAARNFQEEYVRTFRLPVQDSLAGEVMQSGKPAILDEKSPKKIKTSYLVYNLIYVPLEVRGRIIGVLGVDNRTHGRTFSDHHMKLVTALATYAAVAIENASLYARTELELKKLETILRNIEDGVILTDREGKVVLVNETVRSAYGLVEEGYAGKRVEDVFQNDDLLDIFALPRENNPFRAEIALENGRVFNAQLTAVPDVGLQAVIMQDITYLKELDKIKSDFVNAVSHDLRSPLTAILGYTELVARTGSLNNQQGQFLNKIQSSVNNITGLLNDLLDLGKIEAGFDVHKEIVQLPDILHTTLEDLKFRIVEKEQTLQLEIPDGLPPCWGNPLHLGQMVANLVGNAIEYTPEKGKIRVSFAIEVGQLIFQVSDNGFGIPPADQPHIFNKFYRGSNVPKYAKGTGLGLSIVKSVVDNHRGRIWVDSIPGQGSTFTIVLPVAVES